MDSMQDSTGPVDFDIIIDVERASAAGRNPGVKPRSHRETKSDIQNPVAWYSELYVVILPGV